MNSKKSKQKSVTIDDLAVMVAKGFDNLQREFKADILNLKNEFKVDMVNLETRMTTSMVDMEDRLDTRINSLEKIIEKHVLSKPLTKSEFHMLDVRVTKLEQKVG